MLCSVTYSVFFTLFSIEVFSRALSIVWGFVNFHNIKKKVTTEGITIIKPLKGDEVGLRDNLISHFTLSNPKLQILMCFKSNQDPGIQVCEEVMSEYPHVDAQILITEGLSNSVNPLVANASPAFNHSKYNLIWVTTSRIVVSDYIMSDLVEKASNPSVGLAHQMPLTMGDGRTLSSAMSTVYFGGFHTRWFIFSYVMGIKMFVGMSYMFERRKFDSICKFDDLGGVLNEDMALSECMTDNGFIDMPSTYPAKQNISHFTVYDNMQRSVRWTKLRLHSHFVVTGVLEVLGTLFIRSAFLLYLNPIGLGYLLLLVYLMFCIITDYALIYICQNAQPNMNLLQYLMGWVISEVTTIIIFLWAICDPNTVQWGGRSYTLFRRGQVRAN